MVPLCIVCQPPLKRYRFFGLGCGLQHGSSYGLSCFYYGQRTSCVCGSSPPSSRPLPLHLGARSTGRCLQGRGGSWVSGWIIYMLHIVNCMDFLCVCAGTCGVRLAGQQQEVWPRSQPAPLARQSSEAAGSCAIPRLAIQVHLRSNRSLHTHAESQRTVLQVLTRLKQDAAAAAVCVWYGMCTSSLQWTSLQCCILPATVLFHCLSWRCTTQPPRSLRSFTRPSPASTMLPSCLHSMTVLLECGAEV